MVFSNCGVDGRNLTLQFIVRKVPEVVSLAFSSSELRDRKGGYEKKQAELRDKRRHELPKEIREIFVNPTRREG